MKDYLALIHSIGIPDIIEGNGHYDEMLANLSKLNKIQLLYSIKTSKGIGDMQKAYDTTLRLVCELSNLFNSNGIEYAVFKTLKPFPYTPSDIDMLVKDIENVKSILQKKGYHMLEKNTYCTSVRREMTVDLYTAPSVSNVAYLDTDILMQQTETRYIDNVKVKVLPTHAELIGIASHSFFKEQMLTLNDYYTLTILAEKTPVQKIIEFAHETNTLAVIKLFASICKSITEEAYGDLHLNICRVADELNVSKVQIGEMPYKFSMKFVMKSLLSKLKSDRYSKSKLLKAIVYTASPNQIKRILEHIRRDTY